jgi:hypothetical protein
MTTRLLLLTLPLVLLSACGDKKGGGAGATDDTGSSGDDGGSVDYDEGCITVDGEGGYAWINDAIAMASDGSTIQLCAESTHEEEVVVDKAVNIVGPGAGSFLLIAPTNTTAVTFAASGASLSGIGIDSTRSGISVDGVDGVSISEVEVVAAGNWGLTADNATNLGITDSSFVGNGYGGVHFDGGSGTLSGVTLSANISYGLHLTGGAAVTLEASEITGTNPVDIDAPEDGWGAYAEDGATLDSAGNTYDNNYYAAVRTEEGNASLNGDTISNSAIGVYLRMGDISVTDVTIEGTTVFGAFLVSLDTITINNLVATADPETSSSSAYDVWGTSDGGVPGTGVLAVADDVQISGLDVSGFNNCGLFLQPASSGATGVANVSDATITNTGRYGVFSASMDATFTDSSVTGTRVVDAAEDRVDETLGADVLCYYVNYFAAVYNSEGTVDWNGGSIGDNEGWGFSSIYGNLAVSNITLETNYCAGILGYQGALSLTDSTVSGHTESTAVNSNSDSLVVLQGNTFTGNRTEGEFEVFYDYTDSGGYTLTYTYADGYAQVTDAVLFEVPEAVISDNTFEDGDMGIAVYGGGATFTDNSWAGYRNWVVNAIEYDTAADVEMDGTTISNSGGAAVGCRDSSMEITDLTVSIGTNYQYSYDYLLEYEDGTTSTYSSTGTSPSIGLYGLDCNMYVDGAVFSDLEGNAVELVNYSSSTSSTELNNVTINNVGNESSYSDSAIYGYSYGGDMSIYADGISITEANNGHGIEVSGSSGATVLFDGSDITVNGALSNGLYAYASADTDSVTVEVDGLDVQNVGGDGVYAYQATVSVVNSAVSSSTGSGMMLSKSASTITDSVFESNGSYGLECDGGTEVCSGVSHLTNVDGEQTGCDATCGDEDTAVPE